MASSRQIEANRANARRSTGPKTEAGKARSRGNARKHGLTAEVVVLRGENPDDFSALREALMEQFAPWGPMECELVEQIAVLLWRLRRAPIYEAAVLDYRVEEVLREQRRRPQEWKRPVEVVTQAPREEPDAEEEGDSEGPLEQSIRLGDALTTDICYTNSLQRLSRHETMLTNRLNKMI